MKKVAIVTDSNAGMTVEEARNKDIFILPMPFMINNATFYENIDFTQKEFYEKLGTDTTILTSQPSPESVMNLWDKVLQDYESIVHIPMSSGLSGSCQSAMMLSQEYDGRVQVVDNQRISVTQKQSVKDAAGFVQAGYSAPEIKEILERDKFNTSIYIMLDTLHYLKKGGRITPAAAALGTVLRLKPVLQIQGEKLDAFAKARTSAQGRTMMINAVRNDMINRFGGADQEHVTLFVAHSDNYEAACSFREEVESAYQGLKVSEIQPLSLSVSCHIGPGSLALACTRNLQIPPRS